MSFITQAQLKRIYYGQGALKSLSKETECAKKVLLLCSKSLSTTPLVGQVQQLCRAALTVTDISQHTPQASVDSAVQKAKSLGADVIVAFGGGSVVDGAKAISKGISSGDAYIPVIAIPTTLSAAEFSPGVGISQPDASGRIHKEGFSDQKCQPVCVILDPEVTVSTPEQLWLTTGIRALDHSVETLYTYNPVATPMALESIRTIFTQLPMSKRNPDALKPRADLQVAAWQSMFYVATTNTHAPSKHEMLSHTISKRIGAAYNVGHGISSCVCLPYVMRYMVEQDSDGELTAQLARIHRDALQKPTNGDRADALAAADAVQELIQSLGLPIRLSDIGVKEEDLDPILEKSVARSRKEGRQVDEQRQQSLKELLKSMY
ncbi:hypothetical protein BZG36_03565 [Bifiguratus adelaidae]|uniref:Uncharacterized protein n=1 Tax=Bifiguratus adelaidae TaxID=1938954 RepID=A0A261Y0A1_9FUNG|nr:hypothetical protein BZG36_03565 [Bifiguratus adelaidae]